MKFVTFFSLFVICCFSKSHVNQGGESLDPWGGSPGPVKPLMLESCSNPVKEAAPLFAKFAADVTNKSVEAICKDVRDLEQSIITISGNCWIGNYQPHITFGALNVTNLLGIAQGLIGNAETISANPVPVSKIHDELENFINTYPSLAANCN